MNIKKSLLCCLGVLSIFGLILKISGAEESTQPPIVPQATATTQATPTPQPVSTPPTVAPAAVVPTAIVPAAPVETSIKAEYIGATTCLSCHTNQEAFKKGIHARHMMKIKGIEFEKTCETCHGPGSLHQQAAGDRSNPGFASIKTFKGRDSREVSATCLQCHQDQRRMHWQGGIHDLRGVTCTSCHSMHASVSEKNLLVKATEADTCYQCHADVKSQMRSSAHMPVREGKMSCGSCHNPHGSTTEKNIDADTVTQLCYKCHAEKRGPFLWEHPPVRENCLNCHSPHGSHNDFMLNARLPFLCQRCHNGTRHPSNLYDNSTATQFNDRSFNQACLNCHSNIHGSNHPSGKVFTR